MFNYRKYWENRYKNWWNSGEWSYWLDAEFKAKIINKIIKDNNIKSVFDFWCWDWNNLWLYKAKEYTWFDISETALKICKKKYKEDKTKKFIEKLDSKKYDLVLCLEVLLHITDKKDWEEAIDYIIKKGKLVLIFTFIDVEEEARHINNFKLLDYLDKKNIKYSVLEEKAPIALSKFVLIWND